jgi:serine/threonine protein kinase
LTLTPGKRLGPYEIVMPLGAGGMGEVYKARDTRLDRIVAVKILHAALAAYPQFRERFDREARAISQLTHPQICTLYDIGEDAGTASSSWSCSTVRPWRTGWRESRRQGALLSGPRHESESGPDHRVA